jgi:lactoylglutathione lyase
MAKPIHSMIRVRDEARSVAFYREAFGLEVTDRFAFDGFALVYLRSPDSPFELELTVNHGREDPYALGDGYGHLAFAVADLDGERARMAAAGVACGPIREMAHGGKPLARFFFVTDPDGYKIEVLEARGRYAA